MPKRGNRKRFVNPFNTQYGWRTGIDTTAGKNIRRDADGFEDFRDYLSESEAETTSELSRLEDVHRMKENRQGHIQRSKVTVKGPSLSQPCAHSTAYSSMCSQTSRGRTLSQLHGDTLGISSITNSQLTDNNPIGWLWNRNIGRRTGRDVTEGKVIRVDEKGYEIFEDFLSESEPDSLSSSGMISHLSRASANFTREPSKLTEDHTKYGDTSTGAEESYSVEVSRSQTASKISLHDMITQTDDTPTDTPTQSTDTPRDTPTTHSQSIMVNSGSITGEERTPRADKSSDTDTSLQETGQSGSEIPTQSQNRSNSRVSTQKNKSLSQRNLSRGKPTPINTSQSEKISRETITQNTLYCSGSGDEITKASHEDIGDEITKASHVDIGDEITKASHVDIGDEITKASHVDIGGNKTGSITKTEELSNSVVPSFRTRKRISFSAAELEASRRASKEHRKGPEINMKNSIAEVHDSDTESIEIISLEEQETGQKSNPRKSYPRKSGPAAINSPQSKSQEQPAKAQGQGRNKPGKSETPSIPAETSQYDSHEKQMSRKSRSMVGERPKQQKSSETSSHSLTGDKLGDGLCSEEQGGEEAASSFSQEFLFFSRKESEQNRKSIASITQKSVTNKSSRRSNNKNGADDSIDPNDEIEKWKKGKPKVGSKRKKKSEVSEEKEIYEEVTDEPHSHSAAKQLRGDRSSRRNAGERKSSSDDSQKSQHLKNKNSRGDSGASLADVNTCDDEVLSDIEASELVIEVEKEVTHSPKSTGKRKSSVTKESVEHSPKSEVTHGPKSAGKRKSSVTKESVELVSKQLRKSHSGTGQDSLEDCRTSDHEQLDNLLQQADSLSEEERDQILNNDKTARGSVVTDQSVMCKSTSKTLKRTPERERKSLTKQKSRKSSAGISHDSEVEENEKTEIVNPRRNASAHASRFIHSFLSEDHERQELDACSKNKGFRSKSTGYKTRKANSRNNSMQKKMDSAQKKCSKFQNKTFTGTSEVKSSEKRSVKKDRSGLVGARGRTGRKSSRSLHSYAIGSIEKLQGATTGLEKPEDFPNSVEQDADPNDLYTEKEKITSARSKRKRQKKSLLQEEVKQKGKSKRSTEKKASEETDAVNSDVEEGDAEDIQDPTDMDGERGGSNADDSEKLSARTSRRQRRVRSLGLHVVPNGMSKRRGKNSVRSTRSKSLGSHYDSEHVEDGAEIEVEDVNVPDNGTVRDTPEKIRDQDEGQHDNVSRAHNHCLTPVSLYQGDEELLKSGVSFRHRNRLSIKNSTMNPTSSGRSPLTLTKHMNLMNSSAQGLTPILKQPGSAKLRKQRRVTINHLVQEQTYQVPDTAGENQNLSTNVTSQSPFSMNATPIHIFQTTTSESPVPQVLFPPQPKIFLPEDAPDGLRRSRRVRCQPVAWYKGERLIYERRKSGLGIKKVEPSHVEMLMLAQEAKRRKNLIKRRNRNRKRTKATPSPRRNLSAHTTLDPDLQDTSDTEVSVLNPSTNEEVLVECFSSKDSEVFVGPSKHEPLATDPYVMSLRLNQRHFMMGNLYLRPLKSKPKQMVNEGTMAFCLHKGKISVTIHRSKMIAEAGDMFFIPQGNTYSMDNLRKEEARLSFSCFKFTDDDDNGAIDRDGAHGTCQA